MDAGQRQTRDPFTKALRLLRWLLADGRGEWSFTEIVQGAGFAPSTSHRLVKTLQSEELVVADPSTGRYRLGLELYRIACLVQDRFEVTRIALPVMQYLVDQCNETTFLGLYSRMRMQMIFAASVESSNAIRYVVSLNRWVPVHSGASGLAIFAFLPRDEREQLVREVGLAPVTDRTVTDAATLEAEVRRIQERGYACTQGQRIPGAVGVAAPIWGPDARVLGDLAITVPEQRFRPEDEDRLGRLVMTHADEITRRIGGVKPQILT